MKLKKMFCTVVAGVLSMTMMFPFSSNTGNSHLSYNNIDTVSAAQSTNMRREVSAAKPMWIVHIDSWNVADPEKIVELVPEDLKPYVVFNISMSINWDSTNNQWLMAQDGYQNAKSWLRACADENVWAMIQPSSGGQCHFPDYDTNGNIINFPNKNKFIANDGKDLDNTIYGEFFRDYPNFLGFNYCEQFWGFQSEDFPITPKQRWQHFAKVLELCDKYGGYLDVSWCANQWSASLNPVAMLKDVPEWRDACSKYSDHFILEEKYTQGSYIEDVESEVFGYYVGGWCGNFGVRYDDTGWTDLNSLTTKNQYRVSTSIPIHVERMMMNGATVIDGPELIWADDFKETWGHTDSEGYHVRDWEMYDQYQNSVLDVFRKVQDGTIKIPDRQTVVDRTKVVIIQDNSSGSNDNKYCTYPSLFEGLYRMGSDGNLKDNHNLFKSTGRYPTIPTVYSLRDDIAKSFDVQIKQSQIPSRWSNISAKQTEFNKLFDSEYYGTSFAGRIQNSWLSYNPNKEGTVAGGVMNLKYNTCKTVDMSFSANGSAVMNEYTNKIDFYLNNYDEDAKTTLKTDTIKIAGCTSEPKITLQKDRGVHQTASQISTGYSNGTYTITVKHNGPLDLSVSCSGSETDRLSSVSHNSLSNAPSRPAAYTGERQYEAECYDNKNIEGNVGNACRSGVTGVYGQGFMKFGTKSDAAVKDTVKTNKAGSFTVSLRYSVTAANKNVDLYVNNTRASTLSFDKCSNNSDWKTATANVNLIKGTNKIVFAANSTLPASLYIDCMTIKGDFGVPDGAGSPPTISGNLSGTYIKDLNVLDTDNKSDWSVYEDFSTGSILFGDRDLTAVSVPAYLTGSEAVRTACDSKLVTSDLASFTAGADTTIYIAVDSRVTGSLPAWLTSWKKTSDIITTSNELTLQIFKKNIKANENVILGTNGGSNESVNYIVLAAAMEPEPINGKLITNLTLFDKENRADWSVYYDLKEGSVIYGDRDLTAVSVPVELINAETIRTACDSKLMTTDLGTFTASDNITVYIAMDSRVTGTLPAWLKSFTKTSSVIMTSNDLTLEIFKKDVSKGDTVTLGTNGGSNESANYIVMAALQKSVLKGDLNGDGIINILDFNLVKNGLITGTFGLTAQDAADVDKSGAVEITDAVLIQRFLLGQPQSFAE